MGTKLIRLKEGTIIEVDSMPGDTQPLGSGHIDTVTAKMEKIMPIMTNLSKPIGDACEKIRKSVTVEQAEVELSIGFEGQGNLYIAKAKSDANLKLKLVLKPKV